MDSRTERGLGLGKIVQPVRVAISGGTVSPPIDATLALLRTRANAEAHRGGDSRESAPDADEARIEKSAPLPAPFSDQLIVLLARFESALSVPALVYECTEKYHVP